MKVNQLMIGDWVMVGDRFVQITGLKKVSNEQQFFSVYYYHTEDKTEEGCFIDEIEPIPLTKDILEKNGVEDFDYSFHFPEDDCLWLELNWDEDGLKWTVNCNEYDILPLDYVHELQHALRLCGIDKEIVL